MEAMMSSGRMQMAPLYRLLAAEIVSEAFNLARNELWTQIRSGTVNPVALPGVQDQAGFAPTKIDTVMDSFIAARVAEYAPGATYWSEESPRNTYPQDGDIIAWADPLDGTTNTFTFFSGYAAVLYFDRFANGHYDHLAGAIAAADGSILSWQHYRGHGEVFVNWPSDMAWPGLRSPHTADEGSPPATRTLEIIPNAAPDHALQPGEVRSHSGVASRIASVATTNTRFHDLNQLFDLRQDDSDDKQSRTMLATTAGNPLGAALLLGQLGAIVETRPVKLHDAAYLLPLALLGGIVVNPLDWQPIDVLQRFAQTPLHNRHIGPFVAATDIEAVNWLSKRRRGN
ncbi:hypothetical protein ACQPYA_12265 [Micromonospora sp. CA-263727]|uniref:hypothetical protein n=1 Tax=Micromonospora sp. CA-263727 TaxID=3239967 RepID=UPI003D8CA66E